MDTPDASIDVFVDTPYASIDVFMTPAAVPARHGPTAQPLQERVPGHGRAAGVNTQGEGKAN